ncbi:MAG TPA: ATP-binding protein [Sandaracinaceae bacterium]
MTKAESHRAIAELLALLVHDLRNPVATIGANLSFVRESSPEDADVREALDDVETALADLARGLDQLGWIGRWLGGAPALDAAPGDVRPVVRAAIHRVGKRVAVSLPDAPLEARAAGNALGRLVELLVRNSLAFADEDSIEVAARAEGEHVVIEVKDGGRAIAEDLAPAAFTMEGQSALKGRADGRYSRAAGLLAARALADTLSAELTAGGTDGAATFRVLLER